MDSAFLIENIRRICKQKGLKPTNACAESGAGKDFITKLAKGQVPSVAKVQMLADYFGITTSDLLGENKKPPMSNDDERFKALMANVDSQTFEAMLLLNQLDPENLERAKEYIRFETERQNAKKTGPAGQGDNADKK